MFPLTSMTRKPILYNTFSFGGDDLLGYNEKLLAENDPLFEAKKSIRQRYVEAVENNDLQRQRDLEDEYERYQRNVTRQVREYPNRKDDEIIRLVRQQIKNKDQREQLVKALGGKAFCETIPVIYPTKLDDYMYFKLSDLPAGSSFAQYEDEAGRKGLLIRLSNKNTGQDELGHCFERYRETTLGLYCWLTNENIGLEGIDNIVEFLYQINPRPHAQFELAK